jgi:hypothetical protein
MEYLQFLNSAIYNHEITNFDMNSVSIITKFDMFLVISEN